MRALPDPRLAFAVAAAALTLVGAASALPDAGPKYGGTLVVGIYQGDPGTLDPTLSPGGALVIFRSMCQTLYKYDADQKLVPQLAAALPALSKDKLSYTIQLRKGVLFNDGTPFNAQAVVTSIERHMTYPGSTRASDYDSVEKVTASGPYTVVYHLKQRDSTFTGSTTTYMLSPTQLAKLGDNFGTNPVCVGPFMFDERVVGDHVTLIKSPYYYDRQNVFLDKVVYKPIPVAAAAAAALKAGDIDALTPVATTELEGLRQSSNITLISSYQTGWRGIQINIGNKNGAENLPYSTVDNPLARSAKLRQAFEEALDRNAMNRVLFDGLNQVSCSPVAPAVGAWYEATKVPCTPYDQKHAKKLVVESGVSNPTIHLLTPNSGDSPRLAAFIQAQEAAVGIQVVIDSFDMTTAQDRARAGNFDAYLTGRTSNPDPHSLMFSFLSTTGARNYSGYSSPRLDLIFANGLKASDPKARATLYRVAQQIVHDDRPIIYLYNQNIFAAYSSNITGIPSSNAGALLVENARLR